MKSIALLLLASIAGASFGQTLTNRRAPSFSLPDSNYKQYDILDYRGKWLLIAFLQSNAGICPNCRDVTRRLETVKMKYAGKLNVLGIVQAPQENPQSMGAFVNDTKTTIPMLLDFTVVAAAYFQATPQKSQIDTPHVFAVNPQGMIVKDWSQVMASQPAFASEVDQLLASPANPAAKGPAAKSETKPAVK